VAPDGLRRTSPTRRFAQLGLSAFGCRRTYRYRAHALTLVIKIRENLPPGVSGAEL
jgi:hypothetical protein